MSVFENTPRLSLASLVGRPVTGSERTRVGKLRDLVVDLTGPSVSVTAAVLSDSLGRWREPWTDLTLDPAGELRLVSGRRRPSQGDAGGLGEHELMLVRDVLDTRVYDLADRRTVRVGDVWLDSLLDGSVVVAGLEVGTRVLLRRLGPRKHRSRPDRLLPLSQVHLTSPRGHQVQLASSASMVRRLDGTELADLLTQLPVSAAADVVRHAPHSTVSRAVESLHPQVVDPLKHALEGADVPRRRWRRTSGWRVYKPRIRDRRSAKGSGPGA